MRPPRAIFFLVVCMLFSCSAWSQQKPADAAAQLLDHLAGKWVLQGTIAGKPTTHDVEAKWVLRHEYLELHEVSREKDADGRAAYEAIVYLSWDDKTQQYDCMWLDSTAAGGLSAEGIAHGKLAGDSIPLLFITAPDDQIHTTFRYDKSSDTWQWLIDNVEKGQTKRFADVTLKRAG